VSLEANPDNIARKIKKDITENTINASSEAKNILKKLFILSLI
jgi:hypothetical protein